MVPIHGEEARCHSARPPYRLFGQARFGRDRPAAAGAAGTARPPRRAGAAPCGSTVIATMEASLSPT